ncbi:MAG: gliding motility-associated transporter ATP-binding subunit GldA [Bacteroidota bacterium]|jgi:ABC-2 type transport system ATP-binding protein
MSIEVTNLTKVYGEQKAVNEISFSIGKGEIVGFLGPNGAGKSTTMKILSGYLPATSGTARVCGLDVSEMPLEVKKRIGYLPELNALYYDMYVREYLYFIAEIHQTSSARNRVTEVMEQVGLTRESHKRIGQLSKGYKQRTGLAAALLHCPEVLILDEPTSGLDPNQIGEIRDVIRREGADKTVLFSSHILQEVEAICDRIIVIHRGRIVADDTLRNLQERDGGGQSVQVRFREPVDATLLRHLPGVIAVNASVESQYLIRCSDAELVRKQLLQLSLDRNLDIMSLQTETRSLEAIFRSLTN